MEEKEILAEFSDELTEAMLEEFTDNKGDDE